MPQEHELGGSAQPSSSDFQIGIHPPHSISSFSFPPLESRSARYIYPTISLVQEPSTSEYRSIKVNHHAYLSRSPNNQSKMEQRTPSALLDLAVLHHRLLRTHHVRRLVPLRCSWSSQARSVVFVRPIFFSNRSTSLMKLQHSTASMAFVFIFNLLVLCIILYEFTWAGSLAQLTAQRFYRIQLVKSLYILFLVIMTLVTGSGVPVPEGGRTFAHDWAVIWRLAIFV